MFDMCIHYLCFTPAQTHFTTHTHTQASADSPTLLDRQLDRLCGGGWGSWFKYKGIAQRGVAWGHQRISRVLTLLSHKSNATPCQSTLEQGTQRLTTLLQCCHVDLWTCVYLSLPMFWRHVCVCLWISWCISVDNTHSCRQKDYNSFSEWSLFVCLCFCWCAWKVFESMKNKHYKNLLFSFIIFIFSSSSPKTNKKHY